MLILLLLMGMLHPPTAQQKTLLVQHRHPQSKLNARVWDFTLSLVESAAFARPHKKEWDGRPPSHDPNHVGLQGSQGDPDPVSRDAPQSLVFPSTSPRPPEKRLQDRPSNIPPLDGVTVSSSQHTTKSHAEKELLLSQRTKEE